MASESRQGKWPVALQPIMSRPHLVTAVVVGLIAYFGLTPWIHRDITRSLVAWDSGVIVFMGLTFAWIVGVSLDTMKQRAIEHDEGRHIVLALAALAAIASIGALVAELSISKGQAGVGWRVGLAAGSVMLSWLFVQVIFALHYAHVYYLAEEAGGGHRGGLEFNCDDEPDYWDFLHFSIVIGATSQTADVVFRSKEMRRVSTVHTLLAFGFNTAILATMINLAAGLF